MTASIGNLPPDGATLPLAERRLADLKRRSRTTSRELTPEEDQKLRESAREFEAIFIQQMLKRMRSTVQKSGLISGGRAEEIFQEMLDEKYADNIGRSARLSLADLIYRELKNSQR